MTICLLIMLSLSGCANKDVVEAEPIMRPLPSLHQAVYYALADNVKTRSENTRRYESHPHKPGLDINALAKPKAPRGRVVVEILGSRRPYTIRVSYPVEKFVDGRYQVQGFHKKYAKHYLKRIQDYLASRPVDRDMIDDFRAY